MLRVRKLAGVPDLTYRMCRATFGTLLRGDVKDVQKMLGHAGPEMTMERYKKTIPERQRAAVEELDERLMPRLRRAR